MPHTASRYQQDLGFSDARVFCGPGDLVWDVLAQAAIGRTAAGQWAINHVAAANTTNFAVNLTQQIIRRLGFFEDLQEQFGGSGIAGSAQIQGRPDTFGAMNTGQQLQPRTAFKIKGFRLLSFDVIYSIGTLALTSETSRVDRTVYANNAAPVTTSLLAVAANGLATATQAQPYVTSTAILAANQLYNTLADQAVWIEIGVVAQATSVYSLIGIDAQVEFNFN